MDFIVSRYGHFGGLIVTKGRHIRRGSNGQFTERAEPISLTQIVPVRRRVSAKFDAAQTTIDNTRHWMNADSLAPNAAIKSAIRSTIRQRARYEVANNSFAKGIVETLASDVVGSGPRLQMLTKDNLLNTAIEREFALWVKRRQFGRHLWLMRRVKAQDGEAFAILTTRKNSLHPVKLDLRLIEADQVTTPAMNTTPTDKIDGIKFDDEGYPVAYHILKKHPGRIAGNTFQPIYDTVPAESIIHYFQADRPGQSRGLPDIMPALTLFADLRRYSQAVIAAAESAADFAGVMYTEAPASDESADIDPLEAVEIEKRMMVSMPAGWKLAQFKAEQPTGTYQSFIEAKINEIARCLSMPFNVAMGNSGGYNYASGRLDFQTYDKKLTVERYNMELIILDRVLEAWFAEAILISDYLPLSSRSVRADEHQWFWPGREHVDPAKEGKGQELRLKNKTTNLAKEWGRTGEDWQEGVEQSVKEEAYIQEMRKKHKVEAPVAVPVGEADKDDEDDEDKDE